VQAQKFHGSKLEDLIRLAKTPEEAIALAEENNSLVRSNWEKIQQNIIYEGILSKFDQNPELRELLVKNDTFVGDLANLLVDAQIVFKQLSPDESAIFDLYEETGNNKKSNISNSSVSNQTENSSPSKKGKIAARKKRSQWKDQSGGSLFEIDSSDSVALVENPELSFPINALTHNAKFVVKQYQYEKRFLKNNEEEEDEEDDNEKEDNEQYDGPTSYHKREKIFLSEFIDNEKGIPSLPSFIQSVKTNLSELQNCQLNGSNVEQLVENCRLHQIQTQELIEKGDFSDEFLVQLLELLDSLNALSVYF